VRALDARTLVPPADICVADLSFISLRTVARNLLALTTHAAQHVLLVKPQFEAGRARIGKGGVVRDPGVRLEVVREVVAALDDQGLGVEALIASPITGADGNVEFLAHATRGEAMIAPETIERAVRGAP